LCFGVSPVEAVRHGGAISIRESGDESARGVLAGTGCELQANTGASMGDQR
jgi:hypothetical protein